jgi:hypothetical protein
LRATCEEFWRTYYGRILQQHIRSKRKPEEAIRGRNLTTTEAKHVAVFEQFWRRQLASALGVKETEVGPLKVQFRPHRSKAFDVCWPLTGEPRILISIKSMQNA